MRILGIEAGDRLGADREHGQSVLRQVGLRTAGSRRFDDYVAARDFVQRHPARYVLPSPPGLVRPAADAAAVRFHQG